MPLRVATTFMPAAQGQLMHSAQTKSVMSVCVCVQIWRGRPNPKENKGRQVSLNGDKQKKDDRKYKYKSKVDTNFCQTVKPQI